MRRRSAAMAARRPARSRITVLGGIALLGLPICATLADAQNPQAAEVAPLAQPSRSLRHREIFDPDLVVAFRLFEQGSRQALHAPFVGVDLKADVPPKGEARPLLAPSRRR